MHAQNAGKIITEGRKRDRAENGVDGDAAPGTELLAEGRGRCWGGGNKNRQKRRAQEDTLYHVTSLFVLPRNQSTVLCSITITILIGI